MRQTRRQAASIQCSFDRPIENAKQLRCWRCGRRLLDYNEAAYEYLRLIAASSALARSLARHGRIEVIRTKCAHCNAYNSLDFDIEEARPPRAADHPYMMDSAH